MRDEDHDVSDEEGDGESARDNQRIDFTVDTAAKEQERRREAFFAAQEDEGIYYYYLLLNIEHPTQVTILSYAKLTRQLILHAY